MTLGNQSCCDLRPSQAKGLGLGARLGVGIAGRCPDWRGRRLQCYAGPGYYYEPRIRAAPAPPVRQLRQLHRQRSRVWRAD